jgi:hypothetical protein
MAMSVIHADAADGDLLRDPAGELLDDRSRCTVSGIMTFGVTITLLFAMYTDCAEYGEWMTGKALVWADRVGVDVLAEVRLGGGQCDCRGSSFGRLWVRRPTKLRRRQR